MKQVTDYYFDLQNIVDIDDCSDNCNDNVIILFKQIINSILKDNNEYDITVLDNDTELFKMTGGDGVTSFPYNHLKETLDIFIQKNKFIEEKKDDLYNSLYNVEKKGEPQPTITHSDVVSPIEAPNDIEPSIEPIIGSPSDIEYRNEVPSEFQYPGAPPSQLQQLNNKNNIITVKISIYKNNVIGHSFLKKLKYKI